MEWAHVLNNPLFENLPYKIESNKYGTLMMSPASNMHGRIEYRVGRMIEAQQPDGDIIIECSIQTSDGVKVADVAWASSAFIAQYGYTTPYPRAPEICVEIASPSNALEELEKKADLYLARGAIEAWIIFEDGKINYYTDIGKIKKSKLVKKIKL